MVVCIGELEIALGNQNEGGLSRRSLIGVYVAIGDANQSLVKAISFLGEFSERGIYHSLHAYSEGHEENRR